ncbi:hypothetical protein KAU33_04525 [Candidatus Dependentiae bacterium]|nr:hypothetical protein [Candidatus Dependentiae bacterium]
MTYKEEIEELILYEDWKDVPGYGNGKWYQKIRKQVFFAKAYRTKPEHADRPSPKGRIYTIREVMEKWGVSHLYRDLINIMVSKTENDPDMIAIVEWYGNDLTENHDEQRMLQWGLYSSYSGGAGLGGGVLFQYGEMSFHT